VPVAQRYDGRHRIFELFRETRRLTDGTYLSELRWALADDEHAVAVYRATGTRLGRTLDIDQVLLITHREGIWREIVAIPSDMAACGSVSRTGSPRQLISPASGWCAPASTLMRVDFPAPFWPSRQCTSPARTSRSTPSSARTPGKDLTTPCTSSSGGPPDGEGDEDIGTTQTSAQR